MSAMATLEACNYFEVVSEVGNTWDQLKMIPSHDEEFGVTLFKKMFEIAPDEWNVFEFSAEDVENKSDKFLSFAKKYFRMLDMAVHLLGPDMEIVQEQMQELGVTHQRYGVKSLHYDIMGEALVFALSAILGEQRCTEETKDAWSKVYAFMTESMLEGAAAM